MKVGLLLVTHNRIGDALLDTALSTLGVHPIKSRALAIHPDVDPEQAVRQAEQLANQVDSGDGVLILTDAYGSTPSNIACRLVEHERVAVVAGVNLPMLLRVLNYPDLSLTELCDVAVAGGQDGVVVVETTE